MGGDFNCVLDGNLDKSPPRVSIGCKSSHILHNTCKNLGLVDIWRKLHPKDRDYTFCSHSHNSYSRLDYFFIPSECIHCVSSCHVGPIVLSDHGPVYLETDISISIQKSTYWRFNTSFLSNTRFHSFFFKQKIIQYWQDNQNSPVSPALKWDAAKATLRGHFIAYASLRKKLRTPKIKELEAEVNFLEKQHKRFPNQDNCILLNNARAKLNLDHTEHDYYFSVNSVITSLETSQVAFWRII